jgi:hypothetical protein
MGYIEKNIQSCKSLCGDAWAFLFLNMEEINEWIENKGKV